MSVTMVVLIIFLIIFMEPRCFASSISGFTKVNDCTCEGYEQIYECRVTWSGATIWKGSAFNCSNRNNEIVVSQLFTSGSCNNGAIVGRLVRVENDSYISQLTVSVSSGMIGSNISCFHEIGANTILIGTSNVAITTVAYPPPSNVHLVDVNSSQLSFQWSPVQSSCPSLRYLITSSDCGSCPNVTNNVTALCSLSGVLAERQTRVCEFGVQTVVCTDHIVGNLSQKVSVTLRVPEAPVLNVIPVYSYATKKLSGLITKLHKEAYNDSQGLDLSTVSYTINYTDTASGVVCVSATIPTSLCANEVCEHKLKVTNITLPCFSSSTVDDNDIVTVTVSGVNRLGQGPISVPTSIAGESIGFVDLFFNLSSNSATCLFPKSLGGTRKFCSIEYGVPFGEVCQMFAHQNSTSVSDRVTVLFPESDLQSEYCFTATLSNGTFTAVFQGTISGKKVTGFGGSSSHTLMIGTITFVSTVGALTLVITIMTVVFVSMLAVLLRSRRLLHAEVQHLKAKSAEPPAIYEEISYVRPHSPSPISVHMEQNAAYASVTMHSYS